MEFKGFRVLEAAIVFANLVKLLKVESASLRKQLTRAARGGARSAADGMPPAASGMSSADRRRRSAVSGCGRRER